MRELGLDGVAMDYVEADPVVIAFLNEHCNLHRAVCYCTKYRTRSNTDQVGSNPKTDGGAQYAAASLSRFLDMACPR